MAVFTLLSVAGAPGVTTTALGLALAWPRDVVLVDGDPAASQALLAGYMNGTSTGGRGLMSLAQAYREGADLVSELRSHLLPLPLRDIPRNPAPARWFIPGFARPGSAGLFESVWPHLMGAVTDLDRLGMDVILDAGRWGGRGPQASVLELSRCLGVVTRTSLRALAALRLYAADIAAATTPRCSIGLVAVGSDDAPYSPAEAAKQFGWPLWGPIPWQPGDAAALSDGASLRPGAPGRPLTRAYRALGTQLRAMADTWDAQVKHPGFSWADAAAPGQGRSEVLHGYSTAD